MFPYSHHIQDELLKASVYLCSSRWEGFGLSVIEAMEMGLPVISFDIPAMQDILENTKELLVPSYDTVQYANIMLKLVKNPEKLTKFAWINRQKVQEYQPEVILQKWEQIFKKEK